MSQCQPIRGRGEDLVAGHREGNPHKGGQVADRHRAGELLPAPAKTFSTLGSVCPDYKLRTDEIYSHLETDMETD